ncbi:MAG: hypothetical protein Q9191_007195, partial [Dirinaria sp. TL-2023a]
ILIWTKSRMPEKSSKSDRKKGQTSSTAGSATGFSNDAYDFFDPTEIPPKDLRSSASGQKGNKSGSSASGQKGNKSGSGKKPQKEPTKPISKDAYEDFDPTGI